MSRAPVPLRLAAALAACALAGCDFDFNRMFEQAYYEPYEPSEYFPDGTIMRRPPEGTVPTSRPVLPPAVSEGMIDGAPLERVPVPVTQAVLERGQNRYDIFCAPCHGLTGESDTPVAVDMRLRPPPPLVTPPVSDRPAGHLYRVITHGYGLMPSYNEEMQAADRWAVVAYVEALQISQRSALRALPQALQMEAQAWLE